MERRERKREERRLGELEREREVNTVKDKKVWEKRR